MYISKAVGTKTTFSALIKKSGSGITGLTPTLEIRRNADDFYFDFSATAAPYWVSSGGQVELTLPEKTWLPGYYAWEFDHALYSDSIEEEITVIYRNPLPYKVLNFEIYAFEVVTPDTVADIEFIKKTLINDQDLTENSLVDYHHVIFDDDGVTPIYEADIKQIGNVEERRRTL